MSLQQPLKFPSVTPVSHEDFFSGINMSPDKGVMDIVTKHAEKIAGDGTAEGTESAPAPPAAPVSGDNDGGLAGVQDIIAKHAKPVAPVEGGTDKPDKPDTSKPDATKQEPVKPEPAKTEQPTTVAAQAEGAQSTDAEDIPYDKVANYLQENGIIVDIPEGFPVDAVNKDNFFQLIEHNLTRKIEEEYSNGYDAAKTDLASRLSEDSLDILNFQLQNPNATEQEVRWHMERVLYAGTVSDLDPADPEDAQVIIRQYLSADSTPQEVEAEVQEAIERNRLQAKAELYKPKLERRAQELLNQSRQRQEAVIRADAERHQGFMQRLDNVLKNNAILGIELGQQERAKIRAMFANNKVQVPIDGGRVVELGMIDYQVRRNMYTPEGNIENLALAALVLQDGPKALEKYLKAPVQKEAAIKFQSQKAAGTFSAAPAPVTGADKPLNIEERRNAFFSRYRATA